MTARTIGTAGHEQDVDAGAARACELHDLLEENGETR
jgi:hypothetical protein